jgi:peptidyl-prolyl cis-trans isomerase SurA
MTRSKIILIVIPLLFIALVSAAQPKSGTQGNVIVDQVVATVGGNIILLSDVENEYIQAMLQGGSKGGDEMRCKIIEELLFQKLMLNQAELDSVVVTDKQVDNELERRMRYFIAQVGSKEKLEEYFGKSILEIKEDMRDRISDHLRIQEVQSKITANVKVTPADVYKFFNGMPEDSLPLISAEYEIAEIVKKPPISQEEMTLVKEKLEDLRQRVITKGENFATLANLYSMDPGSMTKGGDLGMVGRGETYTEFEAAAFSLKPGEVSPVIKTEKGYHIIQLIERRGEFVHVRHILIIPQPAITDLAKAKKDLENISALISMDSVTFEQAAAKYSDDPTKNNNGLLTNPNNGTSTFEPGEIDPAIFFVIDKLKSGEMSEPVVFTEDEDQTQAYRMLYLKSRTSPHKANLKEDYPKIQSLVLMYKQNEEINKWIRKKSEDTFIKISDDFQHCDYLYDWQTTKQQ